MRRPEPPKLKLPTAKSDSPNRHHKVPGLVKRLRQGEFNLAATVARLGAVSDVTVLKEKAADLVRNRAFAEHQQKLRGAIGRLADLQIGVRRKKHDQVALVKGVYKMASGEIRKIPVKLQLAAQRAAFVTVTKGDR